MSPVVAKRACNIGFAVTVFIVVTVVTGATAIDVTGVTATKIVSDSLFLRFYNAGIRALIDFFSTQFEKGYAHSNNVTSLLVLLAFKQVY